MSLIIAFAVLISLLIIANWSECEETRSSRYLRSLSYIVLLGSGLLAVIVIFPPLVMYGMGEADRESVYSGLILSIPGFLGYFYLLSPLKRWLTSALGLSLSSPIDQTALLLAVFEITWSIANQVVFSMQIDTEALDLNLEPWMLVVQALALVLLAVFGIGLATRRNWKDIWTRLGFKRLSLDSLWVVPAAISSLVVLNFIVVLIWALILPEQADAFQQMGTELFQEFDSFGTIFLLAALTSTSEEILFRGAVQPRFGLVFTSLLFALAHVQYAFSPAMIAVFLIGLVLGIIRRKFGVLETILVHFGYNFTLLALAELGSRLLEMTQ